MTFRVIILPRAATDIEANARWWAEHHDAEQAARWFEAIYQQIKTLSESPDSHSLSPENGEFPEELRDKRIGLGSRPSYRAIFTIKGDTVYVLAVRRAAQDAFRPGPPAPPGEA